MTQTTYTDDWLQGIPRDFVSATTVVYFVQAGEGGPIKIGTTKFARLRERLCGIQTGCPWNLKVCKIIKGDRAVEQALHRQFAEHRLAGEWFLSVPEVADYAGAVAGEAALLAPSVEALAHAQRVGWEKGYDEGHADAYRTFKAGVEKVIAEGMWMQSVPGEELAIGSE